MKAKYVTEHKLHYEIDKSERRIWEDINEVAPKMIQGAIRKAYGNTNLMLVLVVFLLIVILGFAVYITFI